MKLANRAGDSITLKHALRMLPQPDKPWPGIIRALIAGDLPLCRNEGKLSLRECLIPVKNLFCLVELAEEAVVVPVEWQHTHVSDQDAWERLNCGSKNLRALMKQGKIASSGRFDGQTFERCILDQIIAKRICTTEIRMRRLDLARCQNGTLDIAAGRPSDQAGFYPRHQAETAFGLASGSQPL